MRLRASRSRGRAMPGVLRASRTCAGGGSRGRGPGLRGGRGSRREARAWCGWNRRASTGWIEGRYRRGTGRSPSCPRRRRASLRTRRRGRAARARRRRRRERDQNNSDRKCNSVDHQYHGSLRPAGDSRAGWIRPLHEEHYFTEIQVLRSVVVSEPVLDFPRKTMPTRT